MVLSNAVNDFWVIVGGSVGTLLASQGNEHTRVVMPGGRQSIGLFPCPYFQTRPFAPKIDARGGLNDIGDIGAADASGDFKEIKLSIGVSFQEFSVRNASEEAQLIEDLAIDFEERFHFGGIARKCSSGENAALMRGFEGRRAVSVSFREDDFALGGHAIHVID